MPKSITRADMKFWAWLLAAVMGVVIWGARLEGRVTAIDSGTKEKGTKLRADFEADHSLLMEIKDIVTEIHTNQKHIMRELEIEVN